MKKQKNRTTTGTDDAILNQMMTRLLDTQGGWIDPLFGPCSHGDTPYSVYRCGCPCLSFLLLPETVLSLNSGNAWNDSTSLLIFHPLARLLQTLRHSRSLKVDRLHQA